MRTLLFTEGLVTYKLVYSWRNKTNYECWNNSSIKLMTPILCVPRETLIRIGLISTGHVRRSFQRLSKSTCHMVGEDADPDLSNAQAK